MNKIKRIIKVKIRLAMPNSTKGIIAKNSSGNDHKSMRGAESQSGEGKLWSNTEHNVV